MNILSVVKELVSIAISHIARSVSNHIPKIVINMHEYQYDDIQQLYNLSVSVSTSNLKLQGSEIKQSVLGSSFLKQFSEHYNPQDRYTISVIFANSSSGNIANYVFSRDNSSIGYKIVKTISGNMNNHIQGCKFEVEFQNISNYENFESIQNFLLVSTLCNPRLSLHFQVNGKEILNSEGHNFGYSNQPFLTVMSKRCQYAIHPTEPNSELTITSASDPFILTRKMQASSKYVLKENSIEQGLCSQSFIFSSHSENWPIGRSRIYCVLGLNSENVELFEEHCIRMDEERNSKDKLVDLEMEKENGSTTEEESESTSISDKEDPIENGKEIQKKETENAMIQILPFINGFPLFQIASRNYKQFTNSVKSPIKSPSNSYYSSSPQYNKSSSQTESQQAALNLLNLIPATDLIQILLDPFIGSSYKQEDDNDCNEDSIGNQSQSQSNSLSQTQIDEGDKRRNQKRRNPGKLKEQSRLFSKFGISVDETIKESINSLIQNKLTGCGEMMLGISFPLKMIQNNIINKDLCNELQNNTNITSFSQSSSSLTQTNQSSSVLKKDEDNLASGIRNFTLIININITSFKPVTPQYFSPIYSYTQTYNNSFSPITKPFNSQSYPFKHSEYLSQYVSQHRSQNYNSQSQLSENDTIIGVSNYINNSVYGIDDKNKDQYSNCSQSNAHHHQVKEQWNFGIEPENNDNEQEQDGNNETLVDELNDKGEYPFGKDCGVDPSSMRWQFIESVWQKLLISNFDRLKHHYNSRNANSQNKISFTGKNQIVEINNKSILLNKIESEFVNIKQDILPIMSSAISSIISQSQDRPMKERCLNMIHNAIENQYQQIDDQKDEGQLIDQNYYLQENNQTQQTQQPTSYAICQGEDDDYLFNESYYNDSKTQINDNQFKENKIVGYETEIFGGVLYMLTTIAQQKLMNRQMKQESKYKFIETRENQKLARLSQMYFKKEAREEKKRELNERKDTTKKLKKKIENQISTTKKQNLGKKKKQRTNLNKLKQCDNSIEPYAEFNSSNVESYTNYLSQEPVKTNAKSQEVNKGESINDVCPNSDYQSKVKRKRENEDEEETQIERKRWRESQSQIESDSCDEADDDPFGLFRDYALLE